MFLRLLCSLILVSVVCSVARAVDVETTLDCHRRELNVYAYRTDEEGRKCWDTISVMSCWGRCDSAEIADWRFPYKKSFHPVCMHDRKALRRVNLRHCDPDAPSELQIYEYYEALSCACQICRTSIASCEPFTIRRVNRLNL